MKKSLKYILISFISMVIVNFYDIDISAKVTSSDLNYEYGIICEYNDSNNEKHYFELSTFGQFEVTNATGLDNGTTDFGSLKTLDDLKNAGIYEESTGKLTCPKLYLNPAGGMSLTATNNELKLQSSACSPKSCVFAATPTGEEKNSCSYQSQSSNKKISIDYSRTASGDKKWVITYPDGKTETIEHNQGGTWVQLPTMDCSDIYYVESEGKIEYPISAINGYGVIVDFCEEYSETEIEHFCSGNCKYNESTCFAHENYDPTHSSGACFKCGGAYFPIGLSTLTRNILKLIKILVPVIIIIMGMVDLLKAVMASDEKKMAEAMPQLIRKLIAGVVIFLIISIVQFVFKNLLVNTGAMENSMLDCVKYFVAAEPNDVACPSREDSNSSSKNYSCYQCNSDSSKYLWRNSNPGKTSSCSAGYHTINKSESDCK